jgi:hypothetical protein
MKNDERERQAQVRKAVEIYASVASVRRKADRMQAELFALLATFDKGQLTDYREGEDLIDDAITEEARYQARQAEAQR